MNKGRIEFIDAMRGFTMLMVVFCHILYAFGSYPSFSINEIFMSFRMPLFYFLSGFLCYKHGKFSQMKNNIEFIRKKFVVQLIPTFIFIAVYSILFQQSFSEMWLENKKGGYWFTFVLFFYFIFLVILFSISKNVKNGFRKLLIFFVGTIIIYLFSLFSVHSSCPWKDHWVSGFFSIPRYKYFIFFIFGVFVKWQYDHFLLILEKRWFLTTCLVLFFLLQALSHFLVDTEGIVYQLKGSVIKPILGYLGIIIVFAFFKRYKTSFSKQTNIGYSFQYVGQRTLDIYLLHFFFLPNDLFIIGTFLTQYNNPVVELFVGLVFAFMVVGVSLVVSNVLRISDVLAKVLFGKVIPPSE